MCFVGSVRLAATQLGLFAITLVGLELLLFIFCHCVPGIKETQISQSLSSVGLLHFAFRCL